MHKLNPYKLHTNQQLEINNWVKSIGKENPLLINAAQLVEVIAHDQKTDYGVDCATYGLEIAKILTELNFDQESLAAAIIYGAYEFTDLSLDDIKQQLNEPIARLVADIEQIGIISELRKEKTISTQPQIDQLRKALLAMVRDVRAVIIKLAERLAVLRFMGRIEHPQKKIVAQTTLDIFAPLANRLGLHQLKWQLEDLAFLYLHPQEYRDIASKLAVRRTDREQHIKRIIDELLTALNNKHITAEISGRAKHIYSIKRKMSRKDYDFSKLYDISAIRILVATEQDCYATLSVVHELWEPIAKEFNDYISAPKDNGYQSIHTAVTDAENITFEVQIRTHTMHQNAEMGIAAHWMYKEGKVQPAAYEQKITWLRNLLAWQQNLTATPTLPSEIEKSLFDERVYVFTPAGDIIDLPTGATPLDFAYHVHTDIGHRCRGAKINDKLQTLDYQLQTGDRVTILTSKNSQPSRDWLKINSGYLKTSTARAKVLQWFKRLDHQDNVHKGKILFEKELSKLHLNSNEINLLAAAKKLNYSSIEILFAMLGGGDLTVNQIINAANIKPKSYTAMTTEQVKKTTHAPVKNVVNDLLSHTAKCCKPIPGDEIIGYITIGHGVSIHRNNCANIVYAHQHHGDRLMPITWDIEVTDKHYLAEIEITSHHRVNLLKDITGIFSNEKINLVSMNSLVDMKTNQMKVNLAIEVTSIKHLQKIISKLQQLPEIIKVART